MLNEREIRVLNHMVADWREPHRVTNIQQAVAATGALHDVETRKRIGRYLVKYLSVLDTPGKQYPALRYVLTNDEALIARHLLQSGQSSRPVTDSAVVAKALSLNRRTVLDAYEVLNEFNLLDHDESARPAHFRLSPKARVVAPDMNFSFTQLIRGDGATFNVTCLADALELARSRFAGEVVRFQSVCAHCPERIQLTMTRGTLAITSDAAWLLVGKTCVHHLAFKSEAHLREFLKAKPDLAGAQTASARDFLKKPEPTARAAF